MNEDDHTEELSIDDARLRMYRVGNAAAYAQCLTASPGRVHDANSEAVEHTASVIPGNSSGAGEKL